MGVLCPQQRGAGPGYVGGGNGNPGADHLWWPLAIAPAPATDARAVQAAGGGRLRSDQRFPRPVGAMESAHRYALTNDGAGRAGWAAPPRPVSPQVVRHGRPVRGLRTDGQAIHFADEVRLTAREAAGPIHRPPAPTMPDARHNSPPE